MNKTALDILHENYKLTPIFTQLFIPENIEHTVSNANVIYVVYKSSYMTLFSLSSYENLIFDPEFCTTLINDYKANYTNLNENNTYLNYNFFLCNLILYILRTIFFNAQLYLNLDFEFIFNIWKLLLDTKFNLKINMDDFKNYQLLIFKIINKHSDFVKLLDIAFDYKQRISLENKIILNLINRFLLNYYNYFWNTNRFFKIQFIQPATVFFTIFQIDKNNNDKNNYYNYFIIIEEGLLSAYLLTLKETHTNVNKNKIITAPMTDEIIEKNQCLTQLFIKIPITTTKELIQYCEIFHKDYLIPISLKNVFNSQNEVVEIELNINSTFVDNSKQIFILKNDKFLEFMTNTFCLNLRNDANYPEKAKINLIYVLFKTGYFTPHQNHIETSLYCDFLKLAEELLPPRNDNFFSKHNSRMINNLKLYCFSIITKKQIMLKNVYKGLNTPNYIIYFTYYLQYYFNCQTFKNNKLDIDFKTLIPILEKIKKNHLKIYYKFLNKTKLNFPQIYFVLFKNLEKETQSIRTKNNINTVNSAAENNINTINSAADQSINHNVNQGTENNTLTTNSVKTRVKRSKAEQKIMDAINIQKSKDKLNSQKK